jgi:hypothetical protein
MRLLAAILLMVLLGAASLGTGIVGFVDTEVRCDGRPMSTADTCTSYQRYGPFVRDYQAQKRQEDLTSTIAVGLGVLLLLLPAAGVVRHRRPRRGLPDPVARRAAPDRLERWARRTASPPFPR